MTLTTEEKRARKRAYMREYRLKNLDKLLPIVRERGRRYWQKNKDKIIAKRRANSEKRDKSKHKIYSRLYRERHPEKVKEAAKRRRLRNPRYALDYHQRRQEAEAGRPRPKICEICGNDKRPIAFDHCHRRGVFRGWICVDCNVVLGLVNDDTDRLLKLIAYLERTKDLTNPQLTLPV